MAMVMKNFCTALMPIPHGESHVREMHDGSDCGGGGTRQHWSLRGTSCHQEVQQGASNDVVLAWLRVCKRDTDVQHVVCGVIPRRFASVHSAQSAWRS